MKTTVPSIAAPKLNLRRLLLIRWVLVFCLLAGTTFAYRRFALALPYQTLGIILAGIAVFNLAAWWRLRQRWTVTPVEFFLQIVLDIFGVTLLFYYAGGGSNPFVFYYLVPLSISAATLPWLYTWALALLSVTCYTLLLFYNIPIPDISPIAVTHMGAKGAPLNAHTMGMWFNFIISAGLITYFVVKMANALKQQEQELNEHREENLRDEQVLAVATLAAGTAHELGSPLTTMKLLLNEMEHDYEQQPGLEKDLTILKKQVDLCSNTLKDLVRRAESEGDRPETIGGFCERVIDRWLLLRPDVREEVSIQYEGREKEVCFHSTVEQAVINLLNNAADAAGDKVVVTMGWTETTFHITIIDDGPGIPESIKHQLGQPFVTTKGKGLGLGVFLSNATIARYGGTMTLVDNEPQGTKITISLPIRHEQ